MTMTAIRITTTVLTVVMFVMIVVSVATGDFSSESETLLDLAWGRMSLVDIYVGIALVFGWVVIREERLWVALVQTGQGHRRNSWSAVRPKNTRRSGVRPHAGFTTRSNPR